MRVINILKKIERSSLAEVYYAGEFVRDIIRRKSSKNKKIEVVARNIRLKDLIGYFNKYGDTKTDNKNYIIFKPRNNHNSIVVISLPRKGNKYSPYFTLMDDARSREFTINSMFLPISSRFKESVIDYYDGLKDIKDRKIKTVLNPKQSIKRDPINILRAVSLSAETGYKIDSNLFYYIKSNYTLISKVAKSNIRDELVKILLSNKPSKYIKMLYKLNILGVIIPELAICVGVTQNKKYHKYDVFNHCLYACDNIKPDIVLRLSALLHDVGKPQTRKEVPNGDGNATKITFYNHEIVGANTSKRILRSLKFSEEIVSKVYDMIYTHMYNYNPDQWTDAAIERFIERVNIKNSDLDDLSNLPLFLLRIADRMSNGITTKPVSYRQMLLEKKIKEVFAKSNVLDIQDLSIDGDMIMEKFNLKQGTTIGHILKYLLSVVKNDVSLNTKKSLIDVTSNYLSKALK